MMRKAYGLFMPESLICVYFTGIAHTVWIMKSERKVTISSDVFFVCWNAIVAQSRDRITCEYLKRPFDRNYVRRFARNAGVNVKQTLTAIILFGYGVGVVVWVVVWKIHELGNRLGCAFLLTLAARNLN